MCIFWEQSGIYLLNDVECSWIELPEMKEGSLLISCMYRPPNKLVEYFNEMIDNIENVLAENN